MRKLRLGESYTEKYRLEMELQLGNEHRSVRDGQQSEREGVGLESGGRNMHNLGWEQSESGDQGADGQQSAGDAQCPLPRGLGQASPVLSLKAFLGKMGIMLLITLSFVGLTYRKAC